MTTQTQNTAEKFLLANNWKPQASKLWTHYKLNGKLCTIEQALDVEHRLIDTLRDSVYELQSIGGI